MYEECVCAHKPTICRDIYECTDWPSIDFFVQQKQQLIKKNNQIQILKYNDLRYILREQKFTTVKWITSICNDLSKICIHSVHSVSFSLIQLKTLKKFNTLKNHIKGRFF